MDIELSEDFGGVQQVSVVDDPGGRLEGNLDVKHRGQGNSLLGVPGEKRQVEDEGKPVTVDEEQECQEAVYGRLGNDVGVEAVAEFDGVDVVTARIG